MKIRESGMPERETWEKFFDPKKVLGTLGINNQINDVAEFGCGYGTFTIPTAMVITGEIYAFDIDPGMVRQTNEEAMNQKLSNVEAIQRDFMADGSGLPEESVDYAMLFNILHLENPTVLLREAYRILKVGGRLGIIHWNYDSTTPRGPSMDIRPKPEDCLRWAQSVGFTESVQYDLKPHHYGIVMIKKGAGK